MPHTHPSTGEPHTTGMPTARLEAFSDSVFAIIITIMVLELHVPHGADLAALRTLVPTLGSYILSFIYVSIYWNNHHHLFQAAEHVTGGVLWANLHLLFWLSLTPLTTAWMGGNNFAPLPTALFGFTLLMPGVAYAILVRILIAHHGPNSTLASAIGRDRKGLASVLLYAAAIPLAFLRSWIACALYIAVAILWLIPDSRIEKRLDT